MQEIVNFFSPKEVAIIGASRDSKKLGYQILKNVINFGYKGKIYPINPKAKKVCGIVSYRSVLEVPSKIDLAVIVVPNTKVPFILKEVGEKGIKSVIIISSGFGETGALGARIEEKIKEVSNKYRIRIIGPNCLGIIDTFSSLNVSFANVFPGKKNLAVVSQSGAMCSAILDWAKKNNIGFSKFISLGNKIDIDEADLFPLLEKDKNSKVILGYFEGINRGREFIEKASKLTLKKPMIAIKAGISKAGAMAVSSHTGSMAGSKEVIDAAFKKAGIIEVKNVQELFDYAEAFSTLSLPKDERVAVITNAGGPGVLAVDAISNSHLKLAKLLPGTVKKLKEKLPTAASVHNPIDLIGDANSERYQNALNIILKDKGVSALIVILTPQTSTEIEKTAYAIVCEYKKNKKPIVVSFMGGNGVEKGIEILEKHNIPNFDFPERAVKALSQLAWYKKLKKERSAFNIRRKIVTRDRYTEKILKKIKSHNRSFANEVETDIILKRIGLSFPKKQLAKTKDEARKALIKTGLPVALKIVSSDILHKTDYGLVKAPLGTIKEVENAFDLIIKNAEKIKISYEGVMVCRFEKNEREFIVGGKRDKIFGPIVMFGLGGIYTEILKDISFTVAPVSLKEAGKMISEIKSYKLLGNFRGKEIINLRKIKEIIVKISNLMSAFSEMRELDINPLAINGKKAVALDAKIVLE